MVGELTNHALRPSQVRTTSEAVGLIGWWFIPLGVLACSKNLNLCNNFLWFEKLRLA